MKQETISYSELAYRVKDAVLFNNHNDVDEEWHSGIIESPHNSEQIAELDAERRAESLKAIEESTDAGEKAKLTEELEDIELHSMYDLCEDIYQTYAITPEGARYLFNHTREVISYSEKLGLFLWHIRHWGTAWSGVHTTVYDWEWNETPEWYAHSSDDIIKYTIG
jgi:hypothetical protein